MQTDTVRDVSACDLMNGGCMGLLPLLHFHCPAIDEVNMSNNSC